MQTAERTNSFASLGDTRVPALDGVRGVAILLVMGHHFEVPILRSGFVGVDLFFVLSGYLITSLLVREFTRSGGIDLPRFFGRRALRLLPALVVLLLLWSPFLRPVEIAATLGYVFNWTVVLHLLTGDSSILGHVWSLSVEEQYYLAWPGLLGSLLARRWSQRRLAATLVVVAIALGFWREILWSHGVGSGRLYYGTDTHLDGILLGSALGLVDPARVREWAQRRSGWCHLATLVASAVVLAVLARDDSDYGFLYPVPGAYFTVVVAWTVLLARVVIVPWAPLVRVLGARPLAQIGQLSYGLYLWHVPILAQLIPHGPAWEMALPGIALSLVCASMSRRFIEQPLQRRFRPWVTRREPTPGPARVGPKRAFVH